MAGELADWQPARWTGKRDWVGGRVGSHAELDRAAYDELFGGAATTLAGLLRLAGKTELAAKVRPSTRRPGQTAGDAEDKTPAEQPVQ